MEDIKLHDPSQVVDVTNCTVKETITDIDCGKAIATEYFNEQGISVRKDTRIAVSEEFMRKAGFGTSIGF